MTKPITIADIKHRNAVKSFFITFPKSGDITKNQFYDDFASTYSVEKAVVALESHKDGTPHIHLAVVLKDKQTKNIILKYMQKQYPEDYKRIDIQGMRSWTESFRYLTYPDKDKEVDPTPLLINCSIDEFEFTRVHFVIDREISELRTPCQRWEICHCVECFEEMRDNNS